MYVNQVWEGTPRCFHVLASVSTSRKSVNSNKRLFRDDWLGQGFMERFKMTDATQRIQYIGGVSFLLKNNYSKQQKLKNETVP